MESSDDQFGLKGIKLATTQMCSILDRSACAELYLWYDNFKYIAIQIRNIYVRLIFQLRPFRSINTSDFSIAPWGYFLNSVFFLSNMMLTFADA